MPQYTCDFCNFTTDRLGNYKEHCLTKRHIDNMCSLPKDTVLVCTKCSSYSTIIKSNFRRHVDNCQGPKPPTNDSTDCAICHKHFETKSGLFKHAKKCTVSPVTKITTSIDTDALVQAVATKIGEQQTEAFATLTQELTAFIEQKVLDNVEQKVLEALKASAINTTINNIHNTHNGDNIVNFNVFLNEHCKDAMNILDFIKSIQLKRSDIDQFANKGFVDSLSHIMQSELQNMPLTQRPLHCTDVKRQVLHIKHEDTWHKEEKEKGHPLLLTAIGMLRTTCYAKYRQMYPPTRNDIDNDASQFLTYKLTQQLTGGKNGNDAMVYNKRLNKIVTKICSAVKLNKAEMQAIA
jgi:hypothetical protein